MQSWTDFLWDHTLALSFAVIGLVFLIMLLVRRHSLNVAPIRWSVSLATMALGAGACLISAEWGDWLAITSGAVLFVAVGVLAATGHWSRLLAIICLVVLTGCVGAWVMSDMQSGLVAMALALWYVHFLAPWWLLLLGLLPLVVVFSYRSLSGLGPTRRWVAIGLRCLLITLLTLALAEPRLQRPTEHTTVIFVVDRSLSVPQEIEPGVGPGGQPVDRRWERIQEFIDLSVRSRGPGHREDRTGVILFAKRPRLVGSSGAVDSLIVTDRLAGPLDRNYTDIEAALKMAMASFPEDTGRRIVLISDGNENLGSAETQAELARHNHVQIDTVLLGAGYRNTNEILVERVEAPSVASEGERLPPVRVVVRNAHPDRQVVGVLELIQRRGGRDRSLPILPGPGVLRPDQAPGIVRLRPGLNSFSFVPELERELGGPLDGFSFSYQATFTPIESQLPDGRVVQGVPGDRAQNNSASTHVVTQGKRRVLMIVPDGATPDATHQHLVGELRTSGFTIAPIPVSKLPSGAGELGVFLSNFDCVIIANVPADMLSGVQQEMLRAATFDQGSGLVMIGGPDSFGAGGYQNTPIERALPVDCEIKALKALGKGGLVLVMHASEMADGNRWQKQIGKLAIDKLGPVDMVGVLVYDNFGSTSWYIPFQSIAGNKNKLLTLMDRMMPGDMPDFDPGLQMAYDELTKDEHDLATRHMIIISDGDPSLGPNGSAVLTKMKAAAITCTTVGVATHGPAENTRLKQIAETTGGSFYNPTDPSKLPAIYIREARRVSQSFVYDKTFQPKFGPSQGTPTSGLNNLPELHGFVRTTKKESGLADVLIQGPKVFDQELPVLATWQYGLGKSVAFTSDARSAPPNVQGWDRDWVVSDVYRKFWEQTVAWAMRGAESGQLTMSTENRDGRVRVTIRARDDDNRPITDLDLDGGVTVPASEEEGLPDAQARPAIRLRFKQVSGGVYEAEFDTEEAGSYFIGAVASRDGQPVDTVRAGVTIPYSPEFSDLEPNPSLLQLLSRGTDGRFFTDVPEELEALARSGELYRASSQEIRGLQTIWYWLVFLAGVGLLVDVGVRRVSFEPGELRRGFRWAWGYLRHRHAIEEEEADYLSRLRRRKAEVSTSRSPVDRDRAQRKFEPGDLGSDEPPPGADEMGGPLSPPGPTPPPPASSSEAEPEDYFSKLRKAKRRASGDEDHS